MVERNTTMILNWSRWRRWHQAWARYYHARRREHARTSHPSLQVAAQPAHVSQVHAQHDDLREVLWKRLEPLLPPQRRTGHPYDHDRRVVLEAIVYVMQTNCGWQHLPADFPPWKTVYAQYAQWCKKGIWDTIWAGLDKPLPADELQL
jgi:hypothetical protein